MLNMVQRLLIEEEGQGMAEYGLILALVAIVVIIALTAMGGQIKANFESVKTGLTPPTP